MAAAVKVDSKGRLLIQEELRDELGIEPGDTMFVDHIGPVLRYAKTENPFDILIEAARGERAAGETKSLRAFAAENDIDLA